MNKPKIVYTNQGAEFDVERVYRYRLWREWSLSTARNRLLWVMLNPSTADEFVLDPTLRRCEGYSFAWGFYGFEVCNIFALRSTDPKALYKHADPVGPDNDRTILECAANAAAVVVGWGTHGKYSRRGADVVRMLAAHQIAVQCLGTTADGFPKHPLYVSKVTPLQPYEAWKV